MNLSEIRQDYIKHTLDADRAGSDPFKLFNQWLDEAIKAEALEPTAMSVSTVSSEGKPSSRMVLLKGTESGRFVFFTNYNSHKGQNIRDNPYVALLFFWPELERQVRIEGKADKIAEHESDIYFDSRPLQSRIGAIISPQSSVISNRQVLEEKFETTVKNLIVSEITRPGYWGGYAVIPETVEFWQGRASRLHDRIQFRREVDNWIKERLAP
jgi:pyridoxamine 5'-phosphate oxidase